MLVPSDFSLLNDLTGISHYFVTFLEGGFPSSPVWWDDSRLMGFHDGSLYEIFISPKEGTATTQKIMSTFAFTTG